MPIYDQSYRSYDGELRPRFRWWTIVQQEFRVLFSRKLFVFLILLGNFHLLLRVLQIFVLDVVAKQATGVFSEVFAEAQLTDSGPWVYFDFLRLQSPLLFLTLIYAGSGMINNDFRNNLVEIYFSKPINWRDYMIGKVVTLVLIGMCLSTLPALFLSIVHVTFTPTGAALSETLSLAGPIVAFSFMVCLSFSLTILAASSIINSSRFAGISILMLAVVNVSFSGLLALIVRDQDYLALAFPVVLNSLGESMFHETRYVDPIDVSWQASLIYVAVVCCVALALVARKARTAEVGQ
jgi:ABC-type transport system involved in multi-copper enzyme maturation permease subunit